MSETILYIKDGKVTNDAALKQALALSDGRYLLSIKSFKKRTLPQNRYLHGYLIPEYFKALKEAGFDHIRNEAQAKQFMKERYLTRTAFNTKTGEQYSYVQDTHDCTTVELNTFYDDVIRDAVEYLGVQLHYPNEPLIMFATYHREVNATIIK